jgi:tetratricopeptide (TPR) repeat protein
MLSRKGLPRFASEKPAVEISFPRHGGRKATHNDSHLTASTVREGCTVISDRFTDEVRAALTAADDDSASAGERAEMLMEIAMGLQQRPKSPDQLRSAVQLYDRALAICPENERLLWARITARKGTALQAIPEQGTVALAHAREAFEAAIPVLTEFGRPEECAEADMNLGVVVQALAGAGSARIIDAIAAYQRALRMFDRTRHKQEYAILQNNLATAFLSMPFSDERGTIREALAVQAFVDGLQAVNLIDHPAEYAMLQNNLGNALQYASSSQTLENNLRALDAYAEALKVRTRDTAPVEYANTIANRANCLWNLPDDPEQPERGNRANLTRARADYSEARAIFLAHGETDKAAFVADAIDQIGREILALPAPDDPALHTTRDASGPIDARPRR